MFSKQIVALFLLLITPVFVSSQVFCPNQWMQAVVGDSVTLTVRTNSTFDWTKERMDVKKVDQGGVMVHTYRNQRDYPLRQDAQYKDRTVFEPDPKEGGLTISNLTSEDNGTYRFYFPRLKAGCTINLLIVNVSSTTKLPVITASEPNDGAATDEPFWKSPVFSGIVGVVAFLSLLAVYLWKSGKLKICVGWFRDKTRRRRQEAEMHEMTVLNHQPGERGEGAHNAKENGLECVTINNNNNNNY